jgi:hypothetical protein
MTEEAWHRRHAIQIAAQLPDDPDDALIVLELAKNLVERFIRSDPQRSSLVLAFPLEAARSSRTAKS